MASTAKGQPLGLATLGSDGLVPDAQLPVGVSLAQVAAVADAGALTATAPAALTSAQLTGGESPTEAEHNALQADVAALRTTVAAVVVDLAALRTKLNAELAALRTSGLQAT